MTSLLNFNEMLNEEFFDKKDKEIIRLKKTIAAFKKYDNERKEYIKKLQYELEDVSQEFLDLKHSLPKEALDADAEYREKIKALKTTVKGQNKTISHLQRVISLMKDDAKLERAEEVLKHCTLLQLQAMNETLKAQVESLRATNSELVTKIVKLNIQSNETKD